MSQRTDQVPWINIGHNMCIGLEKSTWQVRAGPNVFNLSKTADFIRVLPLLEHPYEEVRLLFQGWTQRQGIQTEFPIWKVVGAGLAIQSDRWACPALAWFAHLAIEDKALPRDLLVDLRASKWAGQKSRQLADLYLKQLETSGM